MGVFAVEPAGLLSLAARCETLANELIPATAPPAAVVSFQPTAVAVNAVNAAITTAGQTLATRMAATAVKLSASAAEYATQDQSNAASIETARL